MKFGFGHIASGRISLVWVRKLWSKLLVATHFGSGTEICLDKYAKLSSKLLNLEGSEENISLRFSRTNQTPSGRLNPGCISRMRSATACRLILVKNSDVANRDE